MHGGEIVFTSELTVRPLNIILGHSLNNDLIADCLAPVREQAGRAGFEPTNVDPPAALLPRDCLI